MLKFMNDESKMAQYNWMMDEVSFHNEFWDTLENGDSIINLRGLEFEASFLLQVMNLTKKEAKDVLKYDLFAMDEELSQIELLKEAK